MAQILISGTTICITYSTYPHEDYIKMPKLSSVTKSSYNVIWYLVSLGAYTYMKTYLNMICETFLELSSKPF